MTDSKITEEVMKKAEHAYWGVMGGSFHDRFCAVLESVADDLAVTPRPATAEEVEAAAEAIWAAMFTHAGEKPGTWKYVPEAHPTYRNLARAALEAAGRTVWEPCERHEIRKGDRVRSEHPDGSAFEWVAVEADYNPDGGDLPCFRIPAPKPQSEPFPDGPVGTIYEVQYSEQERQSTQLMCLGDEDTLTPLNRLGDIISSGDVEEGEVILNRVDRMKLVREGECSS